MIELKRILCATDFSETAQRAVLQATALAASHGSRLTVLHVMPTHEWDAALRILQRDDDGGASVSAMRRAVLEDLTRATEPVRAAGLTPELLVEEGRIAETIVGRASAALVDLLVVGTHGRGGISRAVLGSVAEKAMQTAACPVLTVPPGVPPGAPVQDTFTRILCPVDFSPSSLRALDYALALGGEQHGLVTVLHALEYVDEEDPPDYADAGIRRYRREMVEGAREQLRRLVAGTSGRGCEVADVMVVQRGYKAILHQASEMDADLVVMGAQGRDSLDLLLYGSTTHHVVRAAQCPVIAVRA